MIEMLDVPAAERLGGLKVFRLKYASAKSLSEIWWCFKKYADIK
jgi:general secretion pathway protein D